MYSLASIKGFTLIETIVYIALFSVIMTGGFVTAFELVEGASSLGLKQITQEETNFVLKKIEWALSGATISAPSAGTPYSQTLSVTKGGQAIDIRYNAGAVEIREGGGAYARLTTENVQVEALGFKFIPGSGGGPAGIVATTSIDGIVATTTRYIRQ